MTETSRIVKSPAWTSNGRGPVSGARMSNSNPSMCSPEACSGSPRLNSTPVYPSLGTIVARWPTMPRFEKEGRLTGPSMRYRPGGNSSSVSSPACSRMCWTTDRPPVASAPTSAMFTTVSKWFMLVSFGTVVARTVGFAVGLVDPNSSVKHPDTAPKTPDAPANRKIARRFMHGFTRTRNAYC